MLKELNNYLNLIRFYNQSGTYLLYINCLLGLLIAGLFHGLPNSILFLQFLLGAFFTRSAGCIINDIFDRKIDSQVERTKNRPLASGSISLKQAFFMLFLMFLGGLLVLLTLPLKSILVCLFSVFFIILYPTAKRWTNLPQVFLGITYGIAFFAAFFAVSHSFKPSILLIYLAIIIWTIIFDTLYAMQDLKDDLKIGVKSTAIIFGKNYKIILNILNVFYLFSLLIFWHLNNLKMVIFPFLSFVFIALLIKIANQKNFFKVFKLNFFGGLILCFGILINYL